MAIILASIGNLAAGAANAAIANAGVAAQPISAEAIYWPAWILVGGVLVALLIVIGVVTSLKSALLAKPKKRDEEFIHMLCKQVWKHTDKVTEVFAQRLRQEQLDVVALRVLLRLLREDLAGPVNFVEQMRPHAPATWPDYALFAAFNNWSGQIGAIEAQVSDLQHLISYPVVKEPVDAHRDAMLAYYFGNEKVALGQAIFHLESYAIAVCAAAKPILEKHQGHGFGGFGGKNEHESADGCICCERDLAHAQPLDEKARDKILLLEVPKKPPKEEPKPKQQLCFCVTPQPCHCVPMTCACACSCKSGKPGGDHPPH